MFVQAENALPRSGQYTAGTRPPKAADCLCGPGFWPMMLPPHEAVENAGPARAVGRPRNSLLPRASKRRSSLGCASGQPSPGNSSSTRHPREMPHDRSRYAGRRGDRGRGGPGLRSKEEAHQAGEEAPPSTKRATGDRPKRPGAAQAAAGRPARAAQRARRRPGIWPDPLGGIVQPSRNGQVPDHEGRRYRRQGLLRLYGAALRGHESQSGDDQGLAG